MSHWGKPSKAAVVFPSTPCPAVLGFKVKDCLENTL